MIEAGARPSIHNSDAVVAILRDELLNADREKLVCLTLNAKNIVIGIDIVSVGTLTASLASALGRSSNQQSLSMQLPLY